MGLWPFGRPRKRSSFQPSRKAEKQPATAPSVREFQVLRKSSIARYPPSRQSSYRRRNVNPDRRDSTNLLSYASSGVLVPDNIHRAPLSSDDDRDFTPQKQPHHSGGFASYFSEGEENSIRPSMESRRAQGPVQEPPPTVPRRSPSARVSGVIRKLSKRRKDTGPPNSIYNSRLGRHSSRSNRSPYGDNRAYSTASAAPGTSIHSVESQASGGGAYRIRSFSVLAPRPKLVYEESSSPAWQQSGEFTPALIPSRTASRRTASRGDAWRYKAPLMSEENLAHREDRIDDLVLDLDEHALREAMERDARRREKKRRDAEEKAQRRLERRAQQQRLEESRAGPVGYDERGLDQDEEMKDHDGVGENSGRGYPAAALDQLPVSQNGNQTPLSWFNDNPSTEQVNKPQYNQPRQGVITPVSMNSQDYRYDHGDEGQRPITAIHESADRVESPEPIGVVSVQEDPRAKASGWTSFIRRATAARIKKGQESRTIQDNGSSLLPNSEDEGAAATSRGKTFLEVEDLRHREGQTPGRHVSTEILTAMTALETGQLRRENVNMNKEYEDELRDTLPGPPIVPYQQNDSQTSSRSSLERHHSLKQSNGNLRSASQQSYNRPPSSQRYSPSLGRYGSGSPEGFRPRSVMSTSLASIDSEGSWLSGKMNPRASLQQISPLRTSAASLRRQYNELDDNDDDNIVEDEFFAGAGPWATKPESPEDEMGGARLDLDDTEAEEEVEEEEEEGEDMESINSEQERSMWREGVEKKVSLENPPAFLRAQSSIGMLNDEGSHETITGPDPEDLTPSTDKHGGDEHIIPRAESPSMTGDEGPDFQTPREEVVPFDPIDSVLQTPAEEYQTPMEQPMKRLPFERLGSAFQTPAEEYKTPLEEPIKRLGSVDQ